MTSYLAATIITGADCPDTSRCLCRLWHYNVPVLARTLTFSPDQDKSFFQELPAAAAVFLLRGEGEPYVSKTANLRRRLQRLLGPPTEHSKRLNLRDRVDKIEFTPTGSDFESQFLLYRLLRETFPKTYAARLRLRPVPLVKLHLENEYPRASVTTRLGKISLVRSTDEPSGAEARVDSGVITARLEAVPFPSSAPDDLGAAGVSSAPSRTGGDCSISLRTGTRASSAEVVEGDDEASSFARQDPSTPLRAGSRGRPSPRGSSNLYYGPFSCRAAAEKFASDALDFFKMRRCVDDLRPDPAFPGCIYSEMKMCLAPCFQGCTDSEYHAEVVRVQAFFDTSGDSLSRELAQQRDRASAELAFEEAAAIQAKIEKLKPVLAQLPEIVRRIDQLAAILVEASVDPGSVSLFRYSNGSLSGPLPFRVEHPPAHLEAAAVPPNRVFESRSLESRIEESIRSFPAPEAKSSLERMEQLSILKRWYYRSSRTGEIFFAGEKGAWPLRQIVRGIGRVYRGEKTQEKVREVKSDSSL